MKLVKVIIDAKNTRQALRVVGLKFSFSGLTLFKREDNAYKGGEKITYLMSEGTFSNLCKVYSTKTSKNFQNDVNAINKELQANKTFFQLN